MKRTFRDECDEWLNPMGYTFHSKAYSENELKLVYTSERENRPVIECFIDSYYKMYCRIYASLPMFIKLDTGYIQYQHPEFKKYLKTIAYIMVLVERNPPPL